MSGPTRSLAQFRGQPEAKPTIGHNSGYMPMDLDMLHAMEKRDEGLIADEILRGGSSEAFTYSFRMSDKTVSGVTVVGARHLASHYGKLKHRLVASIDKKGPRFVFTTYPGPNAQALAVNVASIEDMAHEPDFYTVIVEIQDISTGLTEQTEITEDRMEKKSRKGKKDDEPDEFFERPHYRRIAQSKAFRNAVLNILPQDIIQKFKAQSLDTRNNIDLTRDLMEERRDGILRFATKNAIPINRIALAGLDMVQINGLADAVSVNLDAFKHALAVVGCVGHYTPLREVTMETDPATDGLNLKVAETATAGEAPKDAGPAPQVVTGVAAVPPQAQDAAPAEGQAQAQAPQAEAAQAQDKLLALPEGQHPRDAMAAWIEQFGLPEARRLAGKHGWEIPAELLSGPQAPDAPPPPKDPRPRRAAPQAQAQPVRRSSRVADDDNRPPIELPGEGRIENATQDDLMSWSSQQIGAIRGGN